MENFDKQIKKQGESFSLEPRQEVWLRLKDELNSKRRRRFAWWWFVPIALATTGAGIYFFTVIQGNKTLATNKLQPGSSKQTAITNQEKLTRTENITPLGTLPVNNTATGQSSSANGNTAAKSRQESMKATNAKNAGGSNSQKNKHSKTPEVTIDDRKESDLNNLASGEKTAIISSNSELQANKGVIENSNATTVDKQDDKQVKASSENLLVVAAKPAMEQEKKPTTTTEKPKNNNAARQSKPVKWQFLLSAGASVNAEAYDFLQKKNTDSGQLGGIGGGGILQPMSESTPGISILLGVNRTQWISKRWQWKIGASAQLQQMNQKTGMRYDDPIVPSPDNDYSADYFFDSGEELDHRANNYRLLLAGKIGFVPVKKLPSLLLTAGMAGGVNIYSRYLLPDHNNVWYIRSYDRYETFFAAVNAGTEYTFKKGWSAGIEASHDLTKSFEPLDKRNNFWRSLMINIGIPLNIK
jgi:hypothetical protein